MRADNLQKEIRIHICKDGTLSYTRPHEKPFNGVALPIYTVDSVKEAENLIFLMGALQYKEHPLMPGKPWYVLPNFSGEIEDLRFASEQLALGEKMLKERSTLG